jgi:hypothetical protein
MKNRNKSRRNILFFAIIKKIFYKPRELLQMLSTCAALGNFPVKYSFSIAGAVKEIDVEEKEEGKSFIINVTNRSSFLSTHEQVHRTREDN